MEKGFINVYKIKKNYLIKDKEEHVVIPTILVKVIKS